ncbi:hypothetical protein RDWZM_003214 [Blomia tropicalis]|uniref:arginyltransferase n=1 Tax=Blomia tropicalis TaxID=40697 RepID=A0A9Q0MF48_BLOTA|nr:hypothetical protein RDWZM_003214 [Blomia tropicalis]
MKSTKSGKYMNPTDQARKEARKRELRKNKKQRLLVRTAVLKGKDPYQILADLERLDKMEFDYNNSSALNEKVLKDKRRKLKETWDRLIRLYIKDDKDKYLELKRLEAEYDTKRNELVKQFEAVKSAQEVSLDDIPLPSLPMESTPKVSINENVTFSILKNNQNKKIPPGCPQGIPPRLVEFEMEDDDDQIEEEENDTKKKKLRFVDDSSKAENENNLKEFLKEIEQISGDKESKSKDDNNKEEISVDKKTASDTNFQPSSSIENVLYKNPSVQPAPPILAHPPPPPSLTTTGCPLPIRQIIPIAPPPPRLHMPPPLPRQSTSSSQIRPLITGNNPAPFISNYKRQTEEKKTSHVTTIEAKPQLRNLSADSTKFMPLALRIKRNDKLTPTAKPVSKPIVGYGMVNHSTSTMSSSTTNNKDPSNFKDDAYEQFMKEMQGMISFYPDMTGLIEYIGNSPGNRFCGYCKSTSDSDQTYGLWAHRLTPEAYQILIDRNWRRSGKYCYRPINDSICCPMFTIRCDALEFKLRKSQKRVIKNFNNFIKFDLRKSSKKINEQNRDEFKNSEPNINEHKSISLDMIPVDKGFMESIDKMSTNPDNFSCQDNQETVCSGKSKEIKLDNEGPSKKPKLNKKKYLRRQRLVQKVMKRENCSEDEAKQILYDRSCQKQCTKSLEEFLSECDVGSDCKHQFKTKFIMLSSDSNESAFQQSYNVFRQYQMKIHNENESKVSFKGYKNFLVDSPIQYTPNGILPQTGSSVARYYGSYHQHYYIDDRLVAVAVLDILPNCVSSVYLYYDPEFDFLNLGVYTALNEIAFVRKLNKYIPNLKYYYMGFYIHTCPKMVYKANFSPSDLLCSETFRWFNIESCIAKLSKQNYARFCDDSTIVDEDGKDVDDERIIIYSDGFMTTLARHKRNHQLDKKKLDLINEYASLVGKKCTPYLLYYFD